MDPDGRSGLDAEIKPGNFKERSWFSKNIDEPLEKFLARNFFGFGPNDYICLLDNTIVPMSLSGESFSYSEKKNDCKFFCITTLFAVFNLAKANIFISKTMALIPFKEWPDQAGIAAPWKDAAGGGIQYKLPDTIENLWRNGYISPVE